jgi:hypothetical protein
MNTISLDGACMVEPRIDCTACSGVYLRDNFKQLGKAEISTGFLLKVNLNF